MSFPNALSLILPGGVASRLFLLHPFVLRAAHVVDAPMLVQAGESESLQKQQVGVIEIPVEAFDFLVSSFDFIRLQKMADALCGSAEAVWSRSQPKERGFGKMASFFIESRDPLNLG